MYDNSKYTLNKHFPIHKKILEASERDPLLCGMW